MNKLIPYCEYPHKDASLEKELTSKVPDCFPPVIVDVGMIDWKNEDDASFWGGAWNNRYAACIVKDYSLCLDIPTVDMVNLKEDKYYKYSLNNIEFSVLKRLFGWRNDFCDNGHYGSFIVVTKDGQKCARSELTHEELEVFLRHATPEELEYRENKIKEQNKHSWWKETVTKEFPVEIYMFGNDDCSYTKVCKNGKEAMRIIDEVIRKPSSKYIHEHFVFTN